MTTVGTRRDPLAFLCGVATALFAGIVLVGWHFEWRRLVQVAAGFPPMPYNAAVCFLFSGLGLLGVALARRPVALAAGTLVGALALVALAQHVFGFDVGIDTFFFQPFTIDGQAHSGRIPPHAAINFALIAAGLMLFGREMLTSRVLAAAGIMGGIVAAVGMVALFGFFTGIAAHSWGHFGSMSVHGAGAFVVFGVVWSYRAWRMEVQAGQPSPAWPPALVGIGAAAAILALIFGLYAQQRAHRYEMTQVHANAVQRHLETRMSSRHLALVRSGSRWPHRGEAADLADEARLLLQHYPDLQRVFRVDSWLRAFDLGPSNHLAEVPFDALDAAPVRAALEASRKSGEVRLVSVPKPRSDRFDLITCVPLASAGEFDGWLLGVWDAENLLSSCLQPAVPPYALELREDNHVLDSRAGDDVAPGVHPIGERVFTVDGAQWTLRVRPLPDAGAPMHSLRSAWLLGIGLLMALLLAVAAHLARAGRRQTRTLQANYRRLEAEVAERRQAEQALREREERFVLASREAEAALRASEARYRTLVETSPDGISLLDLDGHILMVNQRMLQLFGYEREEEVRGHPFLDYVLPTERPAAIAEFQRVLATGLGRHVERQAVRRDRSVFCVELTAALVRDEQGRPVAVVGTARDATPRKRAEKVTGALLELEARLNAVNSVEEAARIIVEVADALLGWDACTVDLYDQERDEVRPVLSMDLVES